MFFQRHIAPQRDHCSFYGSSSGPDKRVQFVEIQKNHRQDRPKLDHYHKDVLKFLCHI